jgi:hypothetical protein
MAWNYVRFAPPSSSGGLSWLDEHFATPRFRPSREGIGQSAKFGFIKLSQINDVLLS